MRTLLSFRSSVTAHHQQLQSYFAATTLSPYVLLSSKFYLIILLFHYLYSIDYILPLSILFLLFSFFYSLSSALFHSNVRSTFLISNLILCLLSNDIVEIRIPSETSLKAVADFARKTGDFASLSLTDMRLLALTYQLEVRTYNVVLYEKCVASMCMCPCFSERK